MPSIPLHPPSATRGTVNNALNPLPNLLQTPSGLAIIEIQGTINIPSLPTEHEDGNDISLLQPAETPVGKLVFPLYKAGSDASDKAWMKQVYLYIGKHQRMTGEVKELLKPLAVIRRRDCGGNGGASGDGEGDGQGEELEIAEIVKFKILFASRPEPVGGGEVGS